VIQLIFLVKDMNTDIKTDRTDKKLIQRRSFLKKSAVFLTMAALGGLYWTKRWEYIVIHHSAGDFGTLEFLQQVHRQRQANDPIDAIPYHYVIGNGNGLEMGQVVSDWRKENNLWGAHVSSRNTDRNFRGLGICLIGNFERHAVAEKQYRALLELTSKLIKQYNISINNISGHGLTAGESTLCPGQFFPMKRLIQDLSTLPIAL